MPLLMAEIERCPGSRPCFLDGLPVTLPRAARPLDSMAAARAAKSAWVTLMWPSTWITRNLDDET
jgi:hypothetical protein